jgi:hypothetical protein
MTPAFPKRGPDAGTMDQVRPPSGSWQQTTPTVDWPTYPLQTPSGGGPAPTPDRSRTPAKRTLASGTGIDKPRPVTEARMKRPHLGVRNPGPDSPQSRCGDVSTFNHGCLWACRPGLRCAPSGLRAERSKLIDRRSPRREERSSLIATRSARDHFFLALICPRTKLTDPLNKAVSAVCAHRFVSADAAASKTAS